MLLVVVVLDIYIELEPCLDMRCVMCSQATFPLPWYAYDKRKGPDAFEEVIFFLTFLTAAVVPNASQFLEFSLYAGVPCVNPS